MIDTDFERWMDEWQQAQRKTTRPCEAAEERDDAMDQAEVAAVEGAEAME